MIVLNIKRFQFAQIWIEKVTPSYYPCEHLPVVLVFREFGDNHASCCWWVAFSVSASDLCIEAKAAVTFRLKTHFTPAALLFNALLFYLYAKICTDLLAQFGALMFPKMLSSGQCLKQSYHPVNTNCSLKRIVTLKQVTWFLSFSNLL